MNLEEARRAKAEAEAVIAKIELEQYISSGELDGDIAALFKEIKYGLELETIPLREKFQKAIAEVKRVRQGYESSLWDRGNGRGC